MNSKCYHLTLKHGISKKGLDWQELRKQIHEKKAECNVIGSYQFNTQYLQTPFVIGLTNQSGLEPFSKHALKSEFVDCKQRSLMVGI